MGSSPSRSQTNYNWWNSWTRTCAYSGGGQQQYSDGCGGRGSGIKQQSSRNEEDRVENRFNVNSVRQLQSNDKRNQGPFVKYFFIRVKSNNWDYCFFRRWT